MPFAKTRSQKAPTGWTLAGPLSAPTRVTPDALVSGGGSVNRWFTGPVGESDALAISIEDAGAAGLTNKPV